MHHNIALSPDLIEQTDSIVGKERRDQFVAEAVEEKLRSLRLAAFEEVAGSLAGVDIPGWESSAAAAEWVHNLRYHPDRLAGVGEPENR